MTPPFDLAIVGSGFGGSLLAVIAARLGLRVVLLERGQHPRFAIGESASPLAGVILEQLADRYDLPRLKPLAAYGSWKREHPDIGCGLKRGFSYFKHEEGRPFATGPDRANQLLVAASPCDALSDTHWLRADVDQLFVREAVDAGVDYRDRVRLDSLDWDAEGAPIVRGDRVGQPARIHAQALVDASGPRGFLARALGIDAVGFDRYPPTQALYSHFIGVERCADMPEYRTAERPPYPIDAAALHHVFDDGWMWVLRFDNGITSAGVAVTERMAKDLALADGEAAWRRLLQRYPTIAAQFADARAIREFTWMPQVSWRAARAAGSRWAMLPSAAAFVDPLFSTGMPMTLLGVERLARGLERGTLPASHDYERVTLAEADHTARFIAGCYAAFPRFEQFTAYSMFYFAAASFSEMARRLDRPSRGFLFAGDDAFRAAMQRLAPPAIPDPATYDAAVAQALERLNIAGLSEPHKRNWYDVELEDAVRGAEKLGVTAGAVREALAALAATS